MRKKLLIVNCSTKNVFGTSLIKWKYYYANMWLQKTIMIYY